MGNECLQWAWTVAAASSAVTKIFILDKVCTLFACKIMERQIGLPL
jgi:hypothetical protein